GDADPTLGQVSAILMTECVEIVLPAIVVDVGNPGSRQVDPNHLRPALRPAAGPQRRFLVPSAQVVSHHGSDVGPQRLNGLLAVLGVGALADAYWDLVIKLEAGRGQRCQFTLPKARRGSQTVDNHAISTGQDAEWVSLLGRGQQLAEFLRR